LAVPEALQGRVARPGLRLSTIVTIAALVAVPLIGSGTGLFLLALAVGNALFFRNPRRRPPDGERLVVSPADGRVMDVIRADDPGEFVGPAWRVGIFLSIFNAHVQRVPLSGKVRAVRQSGTRFLAAFNREASSRNVQTRLDVETDIGARIAVVQITGLIARRILCYPREGEALVRGEPYGLICYGSRVEIYVPASAQIRVQPGDRVRAGRTVITEILS
jgi:phosphatidylserine decarboxylase